jgi:flagellar biosynthesis protein FlhG
MKIFCAVDLEKPHMPSSDLNLISSTDLSGLAQPVQVIAVTGGKGGVGKTSVSVNLATALAASGKRVVLLDGDLGLANADVFLGLSPRPRASWSCRPLQERLTW